MKEVVDVVEFIENQMDEMKIVPKAWKGCMVPTIDAFREMPVFRSLVWMDEGVFKGGKWHFNADHADYEPILIDRNTASLMVQAYDAASPESRKLLDKLIASRGTFCHLAETLWGKASFK